MCVAQYVAMHSLMYLIYVDHTLQKANIGLLAMSLSRPYSATKRYINAASATYIIHYRTVQRFVQHFVALFSVLSHCRTVRRFV